MLSIEEARAIVRDNVGCIRDTGANVLDRSRRHGRTSALDDLLAQITERLRDTPGEPQPEPPCYRQHE